ncbi:hypothetical protein [Photorhabdus sp. SF281]|uniref:hypothetical protein n=1 Tax=Photorhabdus sp. SF281 TaxID=3459527 RepID=UPI004044C7C0
MADEHATILAKESSKQFSKAGQNMTHHRYPKHFMSENFDIPSKSVTIGELFCPSYLEP